MLRALNGSSIKDQISTKSVLKKFNLLSVNQMNAQIKLTEMWKTINIENYPIKTELVECQDVGINTRARSLGLLKEHKVTNKSQKTFTNDAIHIWNLATSAIKECATIYSAKKSIRLFVASLPL